MGKRKTTKEFIVDVDKVHGNKYDYSKVEYKNNKTKVIIICSIHGEFEQTPGSHLSGRGCPQCGGSEKLTKITFLTKGNIIHNNFYSYDKVQYTNNHTRVIITCPIHGDFEQTPSNHLSGFGCKLCANEVTRTKQIMFKVDFLTKANGIHNNVYSYNKTQYMNNRDKVIITCPIHGDFEQEVSSHLSGHGCPKCSHSGPSKPEEEIIKYLKLIGITNINQSNRAVIKPKELDIYIPSNEIAIEYNGLYYHSNRTKNNDYHLNKTIECQKQNIQLIHIFENEWLEQPELVKRRLWNLFNPNDLLPISDYNLGDNIIELDRRYYNGLDGYEIIGFTDPKGHYVKGQTITENKQLYQIFDCGTIRLSKVK